MGKQKVWAAIMATFLLSAGFVQALVSELVTDVEITYAEEVEESEIVGVQESRTLVEVQELMSSRVSEVQSEEVVSENIEPTFIDGVLIVNKGHGLPEDYGNGEDPIAREAFEEMKIAARTEGYKIKAFSTYRSYEYQKKIFERYVNSDGEREAERYSARPGHSEHQTGLAFDIGWRGMTTNIKMGKTKEGVWLVENSYKFGFILRYPKDKEHITGYKYEAWHFRYVGVDIATKIYESGLTLDEYLKVIYPVYR